MSPRCSALHNTRVPPSSRRCLAFSPESRASCVAISPRITDSVKTFEPITTSAAAHGAISATTRNARALRIAGHPVYAALRAHEVAHDLLGRRGRQVAIRAFLHDLAGAHEDQPLRKERRLRHVVRHEHDGLAQALE